MTHDCLNADCRFFLQDGAAQCPACGHRQWGHDRQLFGWSGLALAFGLILLLRGRWWLGLLIVLIVFAVMASRFQLGRRSTPASTFDARYSDAQEDSARWLTMWSELFALNSESCHSTTEGERLLLMQALAAAADAAAEAIDRRDNLASRYLSNGFDRLDFLAHSAATDRDWDKAFDVVEHHLEALWIDQRLRSTAFDQLAAYRTARRRKDLLQVIDQVRLFEDPAVSSDVVVEVDALLFADQITDERERLRIERALLSDAPRT